MRASVLSRVRHLEVRDVPFPRVAPHEVLVRVGAVGLGAAGAEQGVADAELVEGGAEVVGAELAAVI